MRLLLDDGTGPVWPGAKRSAISLAGSLALHLAGLLALLTVQFSVTYIVPAMTSSRVTWLAPARDQPAPHVAKRKPIARPFLTKQLERALVPRPVIAPPSIPKTPEVAIVAPPVLRSPEPLPAPPPSVKTNVFEAATAKNMVPVSRSLPQPATGGFAPNATPLQQTRPEPQLQLGSFEAAKETGARTVAGLRPSAATGAFGDTAINTTSGRPASRAGNVTSGGFSDGSALEHTIARPAPISQGGFSDATQQAPAVVRSHAAAESPATAVEILEKPRALYTDQARRLRIEGEVLLEVLFGVSGDIQVLRVIRGLGHGLDESAQAAARSLRFKPAQRDGRPVSSVATVHIVFQLAY